ncbi:MAG TPA: hypothetical protein VFB62_26710 [Polyangiaceae bacterium]|nr:hypothetical protein [Polyangiaceae bacterium]
MHDPFTTFLEIGKLADTAKAALGTADAHTNARAAAEQIRALCDELLEATNENPIAPPGAA